MSAKKVIGVVLTTAGVVVLLAGTIATGVLLNLGPKSLQDSAQVPTSKDDGYNAWVDTRHKDATPLYYSYTMYNVTNAAEMAASATAIAPEVQAIGPYTYREYCVKDKVVFSSDESTVDYSELCWKQFDPAHSITKDGAQLKESDSITTLYFPYYTAVASQGASAMASPPGMLMTVTMQTMNTMLTNVAASLSAQMSTTISAAALFLGKVPGLPATVRQMVIGSGAADPMFELELMNAANTFAVSETVSLDYASLKAGFDAAAIDSDPIFAQLLSVHSDTCTVASGTMSKLSVLMGTIASAAGGNTAVLPDLFGCFGMSSLLADPTTTQSGIYALLYMSKFIGTNTAMMMGPAFAAQHAFLGTNASLAYDLTTSHMFTQRSARSTLLSQAVDPVVRKFGRASASSLFTSEGCPTYFSTMSADSTFNATECINEWKGLPAYDQTVRINTGRKDISDLSKLLLFKSLPYQPKRDQTARTGVWCKADDPFTGRRDPNNPTARNSLKSWKMKPVVNKDYILELYNPETMRNVKLDYWKDSNVKGVKTLRFKLASSNYVPSPENAIYEINNVGVFDMTCPKGAPVFLTMPNYLLSYYKDSTKNSKIILPTGDIQEPDFDRDMLYVEVEPLTGKTIKAHYQILVNVEVAAGVQGLSGTSTADVGKKIVFPITLFNKFSELRNTDASKLKAVQMALMSVPVPVLVVACILGPIMLIAGIVLIVLSMKTVDEESASVAPATAVEKEVQSPKDNLVASAAV